MRSCSESKSSYTITHSINFRPSTNILSLSVAVDTPGYKCTNKSFFLWGTARKFARKNCYRFAVANKLRPVLKSVPKAEEGEKEMPRDHTHEVPNALHIVVVIFVVSSHCFFQFRSALSCFCLFASRCLSLYVRRTKSLCVYLLIYAKVLAVPHLLQGLETSPRCRSQTCKIASRCPFSAAWDSPCSFASLFCIRFFFFAYHHLCRWTLKYNADDDVLMNAQSVI